MLKVTKCEFCGELFYKENAAYPTQDVCTNCKEKAEKNSMPQMNKNVGNDGEIYEEAFFEKRFFTRS